MTREQIHEQVVALICQQLEVEPQQVTTTADIIKDLGADSLDVVQLVLEMETQFDVEIPLEDVEKLRSVQDVFDYVDKLIA
ncbi:MAG: acyl carrier protein [Myxococcales bacterium]|nr:acyl carrier protein [Myxococcales bacterium]